MSPKRSSLSGRRERARAARNLATLFDSDKPRNLDQVLDAGAQSPLTRELTYGTLRRYASLSRQVDAALDKPIRRKDTDLRTLLLVGAYQLAYTRIPSHAVINETVAAARELGKPWARHLINAVLRKLDGQPPSEHSEHPTWLLERLQSEYPDDWQALVSANNSRAPMCLRINLTRTTVEAYLKRLAESGITHTRGWLAESVVLDAPLPITDLPGYEEGEVSVQDLAAQFAAGLIYPEYPERSFEGSVLDACAAPGGKTLHLCERGATVTAVDVSGPRLDTLRSAADRLGLTPTIECRDATRAGPEHAYDRILLDAPCSGTGTLRRHPDIKVLRTPEQVDSANSIQAQLIRQLWHQLRPGGTLLYCTCSLLNQENDAIVGSFLNAFPQAVAQPIELPTGRPTQHGWQLLPIEARTDGFYFARLQKPARG